MTPARIEEIIYNSEVALRAVAFEVSALGALPVHEAGPSNQRSGFVEGTFAASLED